MIGFTISTASIDWGNVPSWIASILTSGSLLTAARAYRRSVLDKEREQATNVFASIITSATGRRELRLTNGSSKPAYSITVQPILGKPILFAYLSPNQTETRELSPLDSEELRKKSESLSFKWLQLKPTEIVFELTSEPFPALHFRDAAGRWWRKDTLGNLKVSTRRENMVKSFSVSMLDRTVAVTHWDSERGKPIIRFTWPKRTQP